MRRRGAPAPLFLASAVAGSGEMRAPMPASIHNLHSDVHRMREVRAAPDAGTFTADAAPLKAGRTRSIGG